MKSVWYDQASSVYLVVGNACTRCPPLWCSPPPLAVPSCSCGGGDGDGSGGGGGGEDCGWDKSCTDPLRR